MIRDLDWKESFRIIDAAQAATDVYPPAVAALVKRELLAWLDFGQAFGYERVLRNLVDEIHALKEGAGVHTGAVKPG